MQQQFDAFSRGPNELSSSISMSPAPTPQDSANLIGLSREDLLRRAGAVTLDALNRDPSLADNTEMLDQLMLPEQQNRQRLMKVQAQQYAERAQNPRHEDEDLQYRPLANPVLHHTITDALAQPIPGHDVPSFAATDGAAVLSILSDHTSLEQEEDAALALPSDTTEPSAADLFTIAPSALSAATALRATLPPPPTHHPPSPSHPLNFNPSDAVMAELGLGVQSGLEGEMWLKHWERVLTSYADDVWDPESFPWVERAREELGVVRKGERGGDAGEEGRERALRRLRATLGHIRLPAAV